MAKGRAVAIVLDDDENRALTALVRKHGAPQAIAERARIVLAAADGLRNKEIAETLGVCTHTVGRWRNRFADARMDGLYDEPRPGAPRQIGDDEIAATIQKTLETRPKGATRWSLRTMAKESAMPPRRFTASGAPSDCSRIVPGPSSCLPIPEGNAAAAFSRGAGSRHRRALPVTA